MTIRKRVAGELRMASDATDDVATWLEEMLGKLSGWLWNRADRLDPSSAPAKQRQRVEAIQAFRLTPQQKQRLGEIDENIRRILARR